MRGADGDSAAHWCAYRNTYKTLFSDSINHSNATAQYRYRINLIPIKCYVAADGWIGRTPSLTQPHRRHTFMAVLEPFPHLPRSSSAVVTVWPIMPSRTGVSVLALDGCAAVCARARVKNFKEKVF